jgi:uncharacterized membrane protein YdbT with pleckstrin-like domain
MMRKKDTMCFFSSSMSIVLLYGFGIVFCVWIVLHISEMTTRMQFHVYASLQSASGLVEVASSLVLL